MGTRWYCNCLTCDSVQKGAIDLRKGEHLYKNFKPIPCPFCLKIRSNEELARTDRYYGWVTKSFFIPDPVKEFLGVQYICERCIHQIHWRLRQDFRQCWSTVHPIVVQLIIVMIVRQELKVQANREVWSKQTLTKAIKNGENYSEWPWVNQQRIDEAVQRIARR